MKYYCWYFFERLRVFKFIELISYEEMQNMACNINCTVKNRKVLHRLCFILLLQIFLFIKLTVIINIQDTLYFVIASFEFILGLPMPYDKIELYLGKIMSLRRLYKGTIDPSRVCCKLSILENGEKASQIFYRSLCTEIWEEHGSKLKFIINE